MNATQTQICLKVPVYITLDIPAGATPEQVREAVMDDLRNDDSQNDWEASWDAIKATARSGEIETDGDAYTITYWPTHTDNN